MPSYLYSARDRSGQAVTNRIEAESIAAARQELAAQDLADITWHTDDLAEAVTAEARNEIPASLRTSLSCKAELESRRVGTFWGSMWFGWKREWKYWLPLLLWIVITVFHGPPFTEIGWLGFILTAAFIVIFVWFRIPSIGYDQLLKA